ncbi:MAG TPA: phosphate ABC transporter permease PstA [Caulobacteraceae bacterium]|jgi:phosphate transport system permease protein|nr:phosphate ABC transporter permease PstA [Caulobacteraceae bacterium]
MFSRVARRKFYNTVFVGFCVLATVVAIGALTLILWSLLHKGLAGVDANLFLADTKSSCQGDSSCAPGGLRNAFIGSAMMLAIAMFIALAVGILAGTWLSEFGGETPYGHAIRFLNDVLLSAPSILIGVAVWELLVVPFHGYSAMAGAVALAFLAAPVVTRTTEDILAMQSSALREAGSALGTPQWIVVRKIVWKAAGGGLLTGGLLAFARISGETAPLLFTSLGNNLFSLDPFAPIASLPKVIYDNALSPYDDLVQIAWAGALVIAVVVLAINILGRILAREPKRS